MSGPAGAEPQLPAATWLKIHAVCEAFEAAWKSRSPPQIQDFFADLGPEARGTLLRELLLVDLEYRQRTGELPEAAKYCADFPADATVIEAVFRDCAERSAPAKSAEGASGVSHGFDSSRRDGLPSIAEPQLEIEVIKGPHQGQRFVFREHDSFLVGRSLLAHFRLPKLDRYFSRLQFMIEVNPPYCRLLDLDSTNGTRVNGRRVESADLRHGDLIQGGNTVLRVSLMGDWRVCEPTSSVLVLPGAAECERAEPESTQLYQAVPPLAKAPNKARTVRPSDAEAERPALPVIEGYRVERELGRGGMGIVYLARCLRDQRAVAIKTIRPRAGAEPHEVQRFLREASILAELRHPHIVSFHELGHAGEILFFVMEYVRGVDMCQMVKDSGPLPVARTVRLVCQALEAVQYAHGRGIVHRDIKPANLLVSSEDGREICRLADFGLARIYHASSLSGLTMLGEVGGTIAFMPPEQITRYREARPPADQYAAAATLYFLLTGRFVFDFEDLPTRKRLAMILESEPIAMAQRKPDLPKPLGEIIHRALRKDPSERFPDISALRAALLPFAVQA